MFSCSFAWCLANTFFTKSLGKLHLNICFDDSEFLFSEAASGIKCEIWMQRTTKTQRTRHIAKHVKCCKRTIFNKSLRHLNRRGMSQKFFILKIVIFIFKKLYRPPQQLLPSPRQKHLNCSEMLVVQPNIPREEFWWHSLF